MAKSFEYLAKSVPLTEVGFAQTFPDEMNALGRQGWELVSVSTIADVEKFYFKREIMGASPAVPTTKEK